MGQLTLKFDRVRRSFLKSVRRNEDYQIETEFD